MAFDDKTRNRLQKLVTECRGLLTDEFRIQVQQTYGLDPNSGNVTPLERLTHLTAADRQTAELLRQTLSHYLASEGLQDRADDRILVIDRIVREQAFTVLNRLAALLMMEARGVVLPAVSQGHQSKAFELYRYAAGSALGETGEAYQVFLFSLFDEFAQDLSALFDRFAPQGRLFPREAALLQVVAALNHHETQPLWVEDETIGWIYQYFNSKEERKDMRDSSEMPRNSRELAVRNQFFTPRYVVEFLVDNTLGRLWFNATGGKTSLQSRCRHLLAKSDERPIAALKLRDPRTLKLLDPACGSMHFGLYAFDLFEVIYRDAWEWEQQHGPGSLDSPDGLHVALKPLSHAYPDQETFLRDVPRLIIEHNIYGVDIDPRAAQIASLALWLRAQRAWHDAGVKIKDRPSLGRGNIVAAVAPPAEQELRREFAASLVKLDAELFEKTLHLLRGLPELGFLLRVERELPKLVRQVHVGTGTGLFAREEEESWAQAETRLHMALTEFAQNVQSSYQRRLFAQDALQGLRLIGICSESFDVVVMNPPFGEAAHSTFDYVKETYPEWANNILCCFIARAFQVLKTGGFVGAIFDRTVAVKSSYENHRRKYFIPHLAAFLDTGWGVLDANVETACACWSFNEQDQALFIDVRQTENKETATLDMVKKWTESDVTAGGEAVVSLNPHALCHLPNAVVGYDFDRFAIDLFDRMESFEKAGMQARQGHALVSEIHFRTFWEVKENDCGRPLGHALLYNGAEYSLYVAPSRDVVVRGHDVNFLKSHPSCVLRNPGFQHRPGIGYGKRGDVLDAHLLESERIFTSEGQAIHLESREQVFLGLACLNSPLHQYLINLYCGQHKHAGYINLLPLVRLRGESHDVVTDHVKEIIDLKTRWLACDETTTGYAGFLVRRLGQRDGVGQIFDCVKSEYLSDSRRLHFLESSVGRIICDSAGLNEKERQKLDEWSVRNQPVDPLWPGLDKECQSGLTDSFLAESLVSEVMGVLHGRWAVDAGFPAVQSGSAVIDSSVSFFPCVCFKKNEGAEHDHFEGWHPKEIVVDDASSEFDLELSFLEVLSLLFGEKAAEVEHAILNMLQVTSLRSYFAGSNGFFFDHYRRYTKSRREVPIYWPLSTSSGSYTLWVYYPSLSNQTLYTLVNDFVEPKIKQVGVEVEQLRSQASARTRDDERRLETLQAFKSELIDLRDALLARAPSYAPHHDDGVQITAAPLWPLFRHKPWQKLLKDTWAKLEKGEYDWAHLAMAYWPERVRARCRTDKSLAIAHGLEVLYVEPPAAPKKTRGRKAAAA